MKFTYDKQKEVEPECVAYIDRDGDLIVKRYGGGYVCLSNSGSVYNSEFSFIPSSRDAHKFYRGDSVTITF